MVAAILGVLVSALTLWAHRIVFDTDAYVRVVAPVAQDPEVRSSVAEFVAAKAVQAVDLNDRIESALPSSAKMAAPALTQALQQYLVDEIREVPRDRRRRSGCGSTSTASPISSSSRRCGTTTGS